MPDPHVSELTLLGSIESSLRQGLLSSIIADADFATDKATTLANIDARNASCRPDQYALYRSVRGAVEQGFKTLGATTMITDTATIFAAIDGTWQRGFQVVL